MSEILIYTIATGNSVTNKTVTIPDGFQSISVMNVGDNDASITFNDGSIVPLRQNGVFSLGINTFGYKSIVVTALTTTVDYVVTGIIATSIIIV